MTNLICAGMEQGSGETKGDPPAEHVVSNGSEEVVEQLGENEEDGEKTKDAVQVNVGTIFEPIVLRSFFVLVTQTQCHFQSQYMV